MQKVLDVRQGSLVHRQDGRSDRDLGIAASTCTFEMRLHAGLSTCCSCIGYILTAEGQVYRRGVQPIIAAD